MDELTPDQHSSGMLSEITAFYEMLDCIFIDVHVSYIPGCSGTAINPACVRIFSMESSTIAMTIAMLAYEDQFKVVNSCCTCILCIECQRIYLYGFQCHYMDFGFGSRRLFGLICRLLFCVTIQTIVISVTYSEATERFSGIVRSGHDFCCYMVCRFLCKVGVGKILLKIISNSSNLSLSTSKEINYLKYLKYISINLKILQYKYLYLLI